MGGIVLVYLFITAYGSTQIGANYFVHSINQGKEEGISLTFDDGPDPNFTLQILDILDAHNIVGTFFIIGKKATIHTEILKEINDRGHLIGNHSFSHSSNLPLFSKSKLKADFLHCSNIIKTLTGREVHFFRPPFGITNPRYSKTLEALNLQSIGWNVRSFDTVLKSPNRLFNRVTGKLRNGSIVLFHDTQKVTVQTLPKIIRYCEEEGIKILPLEELINKHPYEKK